MALIAHKGNIQVAPELDILGAYAAAKKTRVVAVMLWPFERLPYGHMVVRWRNGAVGTHTAPSLSELSDFAHEQPGWPKPTVFNSALPYGAGQMYAADFAVSDKPITEEAHDPVRVTRRRQSGVEPPVIRHRRVRAES